MDLDDLKKTWEESDQMIDDKPIDSSFIIDTLKKKNRGALDKLLFYEKLGAWLLPITILLIILIHFFPSKNGTIDIWTKLTGYLFIFVGFVGFFWQLYKIHFLRQIDFFSLSLKEVSYKMMKYRSYIKIEFIGGAIFFFLYSAGRFISSLQTIPPVVAIIAYVIIFGGVFALVVLLYRKWYYQYIYTIQKQLKEIELFEKN